MQADKLMFSYGTTRDCMNIPSLLNANTGNVTSNVYMSMRSRQLCVKWVRHGALSSQPKVFKVAP